jgi:hypothetical protein
MKVQRIEREEESVKNRKKRGKHKIREESIKEKEKYKREDRS